MKNNKFITYFVFLYDVINTIQVSNYTIRKFSQIIL